ncbi:hypothetical protein Y1Q_0010683 [Alligator mississippiensis]|uniref:Uncharacterized protein n=1 Tax=Alligator mississippiensis TaxID=8496 RepID=A0A151M6E8_ALLMI|nr:hypothetical protein Y1Q_0010683 [Alligator mississippiensis]
MLLLHCHDIPKLRCSYLVYHLSPESIAPHIERFEPVSPTSHESALSRVLHNIWEQWGFEPLSLFAGGGTGSLI